MVFRLVMNPATSSVILENSAARFGCFRESYPSINVPNLMTLAEPTGNGKQSSKNGFSNILEWIHLHFLWLLVGCYVLAAFLPGPGLMIRQLSWGYPYAGEVTTPMLLLAMLLFCAAAVVRWEQVWQLLLRPGILLLGLICIWLVPSIFVGVLGWILPLALGEATTSGLLVGLALVAAMPVANSSVAWTQNSRGNVALGLGLIVLTILLSPLVTPQVLKLMGLALSPQDTVHSEELVKRFTGTFFIAWVILPSLAGMTFNRLAGSVFIEQIRSRIRFVSALALLTLNYTNASLALPDLLKRPTWGAIFLAGALAVALQLLGVATAWILARLTKQDKESTTALVFAFSMKHTGLALVLAGEVLQQEPRVILLIVLATLLQHILAGCVDWYITRTKAIM
ncbi:bile acid:sodium symporter family protein [Bythopirellula polymerisocia]|uniref:Sodium Bile acid symporter family protein n=1 Tax=Bythopirellula polymerisocia TaxID=2528003 RepID=A0A5C6CNT1_9BACT|nr:bile acid:sodium symporter [Bythopirellula polymerisocia]TWU24706.1 Sodium Bile acid symporter family protein [Bythopirellula polymerisocia]